ncbi:hypothetical protein E2C01_025026 [Portunus trituberculatus]|uniref:Uncharacterized protein n=1 Tax=Portunus trituberculatus TaxID=210409 RepID=A0A5B7EBZ1_PORTR|nr:hypothetical protein [Portunus trituberculatus]
MNFDPFGSSITNDSRVYGVQLLHHSVLCAISFLGRVGALHPDEVLGRDLLQQALVSNQNRAAHIIVSISRSSSRSRRAYRDENREWSEC